MAVVARKFKKGTKHPPNATGSYCSGADDEYMKRFIANSWGTLDTLNKKYKTKAQWVEHYPDLNGNTLTDDAWLYLWDDWFEENEFGPVTP